MMTDEEINYNFEVARYCLLVNVQFNFFEFSIFIFLFHLPYVEIALVFKIIYSIDFDVFLYHQLIHLDQI
jgi:hypothetical protein